MREEAAPLSTFVSEMLGTETGAVIPFSDLYDTYANWCHDAGCNPVGLRSFRSKLGDVIPFRFGPHRDLATGKAQKCFYNLKLRAESNGKPSSVEVDD
jgi:phage/plasmid-associated DNA primase